jgi:hypothetical protein
MARGEYRIDVVTTADGQDAATESEEWKRELMTPILHRVRGPLSTQIWRYMRFEHLESMLRCGFRRIMCCCELCVITLGVCNKTVCVGRGQHII